MKHFHLHKKYFTASVIMLLLSQWLPAQFDVVSRDPLLPWDQIHAQKIKSIRVMECGDGKNDTLNQGFMFYEFDSLGRLICMAQWGSEIERPYSRNTFQYDTSGCLMRENHVVSLTSGAEKISHFFQYSCNENGLMKSCVRQKNWPDGKHVPEDSIAYVYDAAGRLLKKVLYRLTIDSVRNWEFNVAEEFDYDSAGRTLWSVFKHNDYSTSDTVHFTYDSLGRLYSEYEKFNWISEEFGNEVHLSKNGRRIKGQIDSVPRVRGVLRTTYAWAPNVCTITRRSEGIDPVDINYSFAFTRMEFDERGKITLKSVRYKSLWTTWTRYFYTYYP